MLRKDELVERLAKRGYTKKDSAIIIRDVFDTILECLSAGESVSVHGFGSFSVRNRAGRYTTSPHTGEKSYIPPHRGVTFTCGGMIKRVMYKLDHGGVEGDICAENKQD